MGEVTENRSNNSRSRWEGEREKVSPATGSINYTPGFFCCVLSCGIQTEAQLMRANWRGRWIRDFTQSSDSEWKFQAKLRGLRLCKFGKRNSGTCEGKMGAGKTQRVGRKSKDSWREEGGVSCTIMGKGRPGCGALVSNNDSHVVLFISAIQESIEGSFFISTLSMQLPPILAIPFPFLQ